MPVGRVILVEVSREGNLGAAMRVAANFGVPRLELVRPAVDPDSAEVRAWACGGEDRLAVRTHDALDVAARGCRLVVATASGRGRASQPVVAPARMIDAVRDVGAADTAVVFGNETRGLARDDLDRCDLTVRLPTVADFPVLNVTQALAIALGSLAQALLPTGPAGEPPARHGRVDDLMAHLGESLAVIGFLDPQNPTRIMRKLRRLLGRAGVTDAEVDILRGICRQMTWAATRDRCDRWSGVAGDGGSELDEASELVDRLETQR